MCDDGIQNVDKKGVYRVQPEKEKKMKYWKGNITRKKNDKKVQDIVRPYDTTTYVRLPSYRRESIKVAILFCGIILPKSWSMEFDWLARLVDLIPSLYSGVWCLKENHTIFP